MFLRGFDAVALVARIGRRKFVPGFVLAIFGQPELAVRRKPDCGPIAFQPKGAQGHIDRDTPAETIGVDESLDAAVKPELHERVILAFDQRIHARRLARDGRDLAHQIPEGVDEMHDDLVQNETWHIAEIRLHRVRLIAATVSDLNACRFCYGVHSRVAARFGVVDPGRQNVVFVRREKDDFQIFLVPFEDVSSEHITAYALHAGTRVGLQALEERGVLALYPNP